MLESGYVWAEIVYHHGTAHPLQVEASCAYRCTCACRYVQLNIHRRCSSVHFVTALSRCAERVDAIHKTECSSIARFRTFLSLGQVKAIMFHAVLQNVCVSDSGIGMHSTHAPYTIGKGSG